MRYLYEYWDSNGWWMFINISNYKITEENWVAASQTKNDYMKIYFVMMKVKMNFFIWND